ncbi:hypothetical protein TNCV_2125211 [Trichonephila clavipes]|nr:hypothetical protein TNCV_2125211 [Trichonephila clavipes]
MAGHPEIKRERRRPRTRWIDKVEQWLKDLGVNRWKNIASHRSKWSKLIETAVASNRQQFLEGRRMF